jgi:hypothetical protein
MAPAAIESLGSGKWHSPIQSSSSFADGTRVLVITVAAVGVGATFSEEAIAVGIRVVSTVVVGTGKGWHAAAHVTAAITANSKKIF